MLKTTPGHCANPKCSSTAPSAQMKHEQVEHTYSRDEDGERRVGGDLARGRSPRAGREGALPHQPPGCAVAPPGVSIVINDCAASCD